jgi:hypothetical protein
MMSQDRDPKTHANAATQKKHYERDKIIKVSPLA